MTIDTHPCPTCGGPVRVVKRVAGITFVEPADAPVGLCVGSYSRGPEREDLLLVRPAPGVTVPLPIGTKLFASPPGALEALQALWDNVGDLANSAVQAKVRRVLKEESASE